MLLQFTWSSTPICMQLQNIYCLGVINDKHAPVENACIANNKCTKAKECDHMRLTATIDYNPRKLYEKCKYA